MKIATLLAVTFVAPIMTAGAQRIAPAAVVRPSAVYVRPNRALMDSIRPLSYHMKRGAAFGVLPGVVLSALALVAIANDRNGCCDRETRPLGAGKTLGVLALGAASGAATGAILGFMYHSALVEERQRTPVHP